MRKLRLPLPGEIEQTYEALIRAERKEITLSISDWISFSRWSRFDPRIGELWILAMRNEWKHIPPFDLRDYNLKIPMPAVMGVLLEQLEITLIPKAELKYFRPWKQAALVDTPPAEHEIYFIGIRPFASPEVREDAEKPLKSFSKWGYLGRDVFVNKFLSLQQKRPRTYLDPEKRARVLADLIHTRKRFTVSDYILACDGAISIRTAQNDLKRNARLRNTGNTRSKQYFVTPKNQGKKKD